MFKVCENSNPTHTYSIHLCLKQMPLIHILSRQMSFILICSTPTLTQQQSQIEILYRLQYICRLSHSHTHKLWLYTKSYGRQLFCKHLRENPHKNAHITVRVMLNFGKLYQIYKVNALTIDLQAISDYLAWIKKNGFGVLQAIKWYALQHLIGTLVPTQVQDLTKMARLWSTLIIH